MATPRRRWFKVADSILREDLTPFGRSTFLGLLSWFNQRRARDGLTAGEARAASIPPGDLLTITLADSLDDARARLAEVQPRFELVVEARGRFTVVEWPNLADFQEWELPTAGQSTGRARAEHGQSTGDTQPAERPRGSRQLPAPNLLLRSEDSAPKKKTPPTPLSRVRLRGAGPPTAEAAIGPPEVFFQRKPKPPDAFDREQIAGLPESFLLELAADRLDLAATAGAVRCWLHSAAPKMRNSGKHSLRLTARKWWTRVTREELREAIDRETLVAAKAQVAVSAAAQARDPPPWPPENRPWTAEDQALFGDEDET